MSTASNHARAIGRRTACALAPLVFLLAIQTTNHTPAGAADTITDANVTDAIAAAKTPQDHQAIAAYFRAQAAAAGEKVKLHEAMLASWEKTVSGKGLEHMRTH